MTELPNPNQNLLPSEKKCKKQISITAHEWKSNIIPEQSCSIFFCKSGTENILKSSTTIWF